SLEAWTSPRLGSCRPAIVRSSVDFPDPFCPTIPTDSPSRATSDKPRRARTVAFGFIPRTRRNAWNLRDPEPVSFFAVATRNFTWRSLTATVTGGLSRSSITGVALLARPEEQEPDDDCDERPPACDEPRR